MNFQFDIYLCLIISFTNAFLLCLNIERPVLILQQSGYERKKYLQWLKEKSEDYKNKTVVLSFIGLISFLFFGGIFFTLINEKFVPILSSFCYIAVSIIFSKNERTEQKKLPLKFTKRIIRLYITVFTISFIFSLLISCISEQFFVLLNDSYFYSVRYLLLTLFPIFLGEIVFISSIFVSPVEKCIYNGYKKKTKKILSEYDFTKIGITGSFAKTSVKNILDLMLSEKYKTIASEKSFNTPMGISRTVKKITGDENYFIAEMGARKCGDIKELCEMVCPSIGVLTGIASQHLETFKKEENILNTKYELFSNGNIKKAFFSSDSKGSIELYNRYEKEKYLAGLCGDFVFASDIKMGENGTEFFLHIRGEKPIKCFTLILGKHNVSNICLASAVAYSEGVSVNEIVRAIAKLKQIPHRLEIKKTNDKIIIDDTFNASEVGVKASIEVLNNFRGYKTVITPGIVELGEKQFAINYDFGKLLAQNVNRIVIIGSTNKRAISEGIESAKTNKKVLFFTSLIEAMSKLQFVKGEVVLFENDLPDCYT
ncbi:MAG: UDP-N-acetylmuramoyl-tripeptide--D-alanyl-D-alanine ligase [Clostridia bacterium]|nr:UDP-N-acetylmuramoyl-tripeptide--D-alanyl-D-alanine ligase [Clostridia bacterium]